MAVQIYKNTVNVYTSKLLFSLFFYVFEVDEIDYLEGAKYAHRNRSHSSLFNT